MIKSIVLPKDPGLGNMLAFWVLKRFGKGVRGVATARVIQRKTEWPFDSTELALNRATLKEGESLLDAVLSLCKLEDAVLQNFLQFCYADTESKLLTEFSRETKELTLAKLIAWSMAKFDESFARFKEARPAFQKSHSVFKPEHKLMVAARVGRIPPERTIRLQRPNGEMIVFGFAIDNGKFKLDDGVDIMFIMRGDDATGYTIMSRFSIRGVARALRIAEFMRANRSKANFARISNIWKDLSEVGIHWLAPQWLYEKRESGLHHVVSTGISTPRTFLQVGEMITLVRNAVDNRFEPHREPRCLQFKCNSHPDFPCPWMHLNFGKCRQIRETAKKEQNTVEQEKPKKPSKKKKK